MAGKSSKGKNRGKGHNSVRSQSNSVPASDTGSLGDSSALVIENGHASAPHDTDPGKVQDHSQKEGEVPELSHVDQHGPTESVSQGKQDEGELHLYPLSVRTLSGEKLDLQLNPRDSVMDIRQFLLDAPETCYFTCYDLVLHANDGATHRLEDYSEISEVTDITNGGCSLEMLAAPYDDRSIRSHIRRARELLSLSCIHSSLSTSLALQSEAKEKTSADRPEVSEIEGMGYMNDAMSSLSNIMSSAPKEMKCVESIVFSSFNPPPSYRRLAGDLIYLDIETLEGQKVCFTGSSRAFYVNSSVGNTLDPKHAKSTNEATTLIGLLQKISAKFKKGFREILDWKASTHPFENVQCWLPSNPWLGVFPLPDHKRDPSRAEEAVALSFGSELIGMQRDWNEELQSCREFPHKLFQERILRDRAIYKVSCDFVEAAASGAVGVINGCIPPINPTDPECFHMYVHNNIFFSFAVDSDIPLLVKGSGETTNKEMQAENNFGQMNTQNLSNGLFDSSIDVTNEKQNKLSDTADEILKTDDKCAINDAADNEQATYASANNDLRGTKAYQEADVPGLYNLAMAIIDYRGHRVVAQSIIPGILQGDKSDSLLYGSVDNGKKICYNEAFHAKVLEAAKHLHLKEHSVFDGAGNIVKLAAPVECKGIVGSDDRHYLLDLMRVTPRDANYTGPGSRFYVLRPELVSAFCQLEASESSKIDIKQGQVLSQSGPVGADSEGLGKPEIEKDVIMGNKDSDKHVETANQNEQIVLNPNVLTEFKLSGTDEEIAADEAVVRKAGSYLVDVVLPKFVQDLDTLEVSPMDGQTLTEAFHAHGINIRYLGKVASMAKHLPHIWDLCVIEIVVRSAKHIFKDILRQSHDHELASSISHFLNCFLGVYGPANTSSGSMQSKSLIKEKTSKDAVENSPKGRRKSNQAIDGKKNSLYTNLTNESLWLDIEEFAKLKYQFTLPEDAKSRVRKVPAIRNFCQKVGVVIAARRYSFEPSLPFQVSDILDLVPVVKHSIPVCGEAKDLIEAGKIRLAEGMLNEAFKLFSEAFSILQQVTGPMHREVANCCRYLAMVLYHAGDITGAVMQQHKELIINERCLGLDHPDTAHSYGNMALFYHGLNQTELALRHMSRTLLLLSLSCGQDHPDVAATFINVAMMYQDIGKMDTALRYLQEALKTNERLLGSEHIQTAVCYHALAIAFNCMGAYKLSLQHERRTYDILVKQLGEEDSRTRDSQNWINTFKLRDIQLNAQKQKGQTVNAISAQKAIDLLRAHPDLVQAFQVASAAPGNGTTDKSVNAGLVGDPVRRGRGADERATRAAAEVRRRAAARGLIVRPHGLGPPQTLPPLTQLLSMISSGALTEAQLSSVKETSTCASDASIEATVNSVEDIPVGLGAGLGSLDSKKQSSAAESIA